MQYILIDGKKYRLEPVEEEKVLEEEVLEGYKAEESRLERNTEPLENTVPKANSSLGGVERAEPKKYGYRERFKEGRVRPSDIMVLDRKVPSIKQFDPGGIDPGTAQHFFGPGTEIDF